ncbi:hypothetical protein SASPL_100129 [Salvia splendens]|uniref:Mitochondrial inner membrane organizing system protein 1 n=1 Tax=Salvia splendens TaxID=180675 RepID=A0A8X8YNL7_SALSN|nr:hypothetical protein SASPL_100129 [Salvia splendens]
MVENKAEIPEKYDLNAKWDACLDLSVRRFVYSSFTGGFAGLLLFRECFLTHMCFELMVSVVAKECMQIGVDRIFIDQFAQLVSYVNVASGSPVTRWASVAFGAGLGIGSAYSECAHKFNTSSPKFTPCVSETPMPEVSQNSTFFVTFFPDNHWLYHFHLVVPQKKLWARP